MNSRQDDKMLSSSRGEPEAMPRIGRFVVLNRIGVGAMGEVFSAYDAELDRKIAIKLLRRDARSNPRGTERLVREALALARLSHPNVVQVYDVGQLDGGVFIAMEFIQGRDLSRWISDQRRGWREIVDVFVQAGQGLMAAHAAGLVHRDFKPDNVMVGADDRVRVLDFSVASAGEPISSSVDLHTSDPDLMASQPSTLTETEALVGTPAYMAPEQLRRLGADAASDQFSFCVALHEALYGVRPFVGVTMGELLAQMEKGPRAAPPHEGPRVPKRIYRALVRGLASAPHERFRSMRELLSVLRGSARKLSPWLVAPLVAASLTAAGIVGWRLVDDSGGACTHGHEQLAGVWDPGRQAALRTAFVGSPIAYARSTLGRVEPLLARHADAWVAMYTQSCLAHQEGEISAALLDQRMSCLRARRGELRALVDVLSEGSRAAVENASHAVGALIPLDRCAEDTLERARVSLPAPELAADVQALELELARIKAEYDAGLYDTGLVLSTAAVQRARDLAYEPALAQALSYHGMLLTQKGQFPEAEAILLEALPLADASADDRLRVELLSTLVFVIAESQGRPAEGLRVAQQAWGALRRMGGDGPLETWLLIAEGTALRAQNEPLAARKRLERALELADSEPGENTRVLALNELGNVAIALKDYPTAGRHLEEAVALTLHELGPEHPRLIYFNNNLANLYLLDGRPDAAERVLGEALRIAETSLGGQHPTVATVLDSLGLVRAARQDLPGAIALFARSRQILEASFGPTHPSLLPVTLDMLEAEIAQDAVDAAIASTDRAIAIWEANNRDNPLDEYLVHLILRLTPKLPAAEAERSRRYLELSVTISRSRRSTPNLIASLATLAPIELSAGKSSQAQERVQEAVEVSRSASAEVDPIDLGRARLALAEALWSTGERARGLALADSITLPDAGAEEVRADLTAWLRAARPAAAP